MWTSPNRSTGNWEEVYNRKSLALVFWSKFVNEAGSGVKGTRVSFAMRARVRMFVQPPFLFVFTLHLMLFCKYKEQTSSQ